MNAPPSRLWIGRDETDAAAWQQVCAERGVTSSALPLVHSLALPPPIELVAALADAAFQWDWLFLTSARGVARWAALAGPRAWTAAQHVAVVGLATAAAVREAGGDPELIGDAGGEALAAAFLARVGAQSSPLQLLYVGAADARPELRDSLSAHGLSLTEWPAYRTIPLPGPTPPPGEPVLLFSPSGAASLRDRVDDASGHPAWAVGPSTASAARAAGFPVDAVLETPSPEALAALLRR